MPEAKQTGVHTATGTAETLTMSGMLDGGLVWVDALFSTVVARFWKSSALLSFNDSDYTSGGKFNEV